MQSLSKVDADQLPSVQSNFKTLGKFCGSLKIELREWSEDLDYNCFNLGTDIDDYVFWDNGLGYRLLCPSDIDAIVQDFDTGLGDLPRGIYKELIKIRDSNEWYIYYSAH